MRSTTMHTPSRFRVCSLLLASFLLGVVAASFLSGTKGVVPSQPDHLPLTQSTASVD